MTPSSLRVPGPSQPGPNGVIGPPAPVRPPRREVSGSLRFVRPPALPGRGEAGMVLAALGLAPFLAAALGLVLIVHASAPMVAEVVAAASTSTPEGTPSAAPGFASPRVGGVPPAPRIAR